jgi:hypothetical protein
VIKTLPAQQSALAYVRGWRSVRGTGPDVECSTFGEVSAVAGCKPAHEPRAVLPHSRKSGAFACDRVAPCACGRRPVTREIRRRLEALYREGKSGGVAAEACGVSESLAYYHFRKFRRAGVPRGKVILRRAYRQLGMRLPVYSGPVWLGRACSATPVPIGPEWIGKREQRKHD